MVTQNRKNEKTGASGKVMQGQGIGVANDFSTATYPSTATGTGTILRADGTNWVASTATYPDTAGTAGNALTSNGTNFASTAYKGSIINIKTSNSNPADSTTYYLSNGRALGDFTTSGTSATRIYIPQSGIIVRCYGLFTVGGTLGSAQNCTVGIRLNDTTDTNVTTTFQLTATDNTFSNTGLSISVSAGDFIEFFFTGPAWTTNPTTVRTAISACIV